MNYSYFFKAWKMQISNTFQFHLIQANQFWNHELLVQDCNEKRTNIFFKAMIFLFLTLPGTKY